MNPTDRTRIRRVPENAQYDLATLHAILDAAWVCHIAFADDKGVHCIPTACWREGEHLYIHGSNGGRLVRTLAGRAQVCVTVMLLDGLVASRSAFNHSMNYRSAMIYGQFEVAEDKRGHLDAFMEHLVPGRTPHVRPGNDKEMAATTVLRIGLDEAVCKVRAGGPRDDEEDMQWPAWAGELPLVTLRGAPVRDAHCSLDAPAHVQAWGQPLA